MMGKTPHRLLVRQDDIPDASFLFAFPTVPLRLNLRPVAAFGRHGSAGEASAETGRLAAPAAASVAALLSAPTTDLSRASDTGFFGSIA